MRKLREEINSFNARPNIQDDQDEQQRLISEQKALLKSYFSKNHGSNVVPFFSQPS